MKLPISVVNCHWNYLIIYLIFTLENYEPYLNAHSESSKVKYLIDYHAQNHLDSSPNTMAQDLWYCM